MSAVAIDQNEFLICHFVVCNVRMCLDLACINKVLPLAELEILPGSPYYVAGLLNLAGNSVPVIDLALRLGLTRKKPYSTNNPVLLCASDKEQVGLIIDTVVGLTNITKEQLQTRPEFAKPNSPFMATVLINTELSLLIDIQKIIPVDLLDEQLSGDKHLYNIVKHKNE